jgi:hypothetical protein
VDKAEQCESNDPHSQKLGESCNPEMKFVVSCQALLSPQIGVQMVNHPCFDALGGAGNTPVFAGALPTTPPLSLREASVLQALAIPFPAAGNHQSAVCTRLNAMQHLNVQNGGISLHTHSGLFAASTLPVGTLPTSTLGGPIGVAITTVEALPPHSGHVITVHCKAFSSCG